MFYFFLVHFTDLADLDCRDVSFNNLSGPLPKISARAFKWDLFFFQYIISAVEEVILKIIEIDLFMPLCIYFSLTIIM